MRTRECTMGLLQSRLPVQGSECETRETSTPRQDADRSCDAGNQLLQCLLPIKHLKPLLYHPPVSKIAVTAFSHAHAASTLASAAFTPHAHCCNSRRPSTCFHAGQKSVSRPFCLVWPQNKNAVHKGTSLVQKLLRLFYPHQPHCVHAIIFDVSVRLHRNTTNRKYIPLRFSAPMQASAGKSNELSVKIVSKLIGGLVG